MGVEVRLVKRVHVFIKHTVILKRLHDVIDDGVFDALIQVALQLLEFQLQTLELPSDADYTHQRVNGYKLDEERHDARSFKDVLIGVSTKLRCQHLVAFDKVAMRLHGKKRVYFSYDPKDLRYSHRLADSNIFVETNLNANLIVGICRALLEALGHDIANFGID